MDAEQTKRAVAALSTPQAMALLFAIKDSQWYIPSRAADKAKVHVSTATKHLSALHRAGVLDRRQVRTATGHAYAYRLPRPSVTLTLDLFPDSGTLRQDQVTAAIDLLGQIVRKARTLGAGVSSRGVKALKAAFPRELGTGSDADVDGLLGRLRAAPGIRLEQVVAAVRGVRAALDAAIGPLACDRIFQLSFEAASAGSRSRLPAILLWGREVAS